MPLSTLPRAALGSSAGTRHLPGPVVGDSPSPPRQAPGLARPEQRPETPDNAGQSAESIDAQG